MAKKKKSTVTSSVIDLFNSTKIGNSSEVENEDLVPNLLLSEADKYKNDKEAIKKLFRYNESICLGQITHKKVKYEDNYKLAKGIINKDDYFITDEDPELKLLDEKPPSSIELEFFPIIPNIVNILKQEMQRVYFNIHPKMVDNESTNEALYLLSSKIKQEVISTLNKSFTQVESINNTPQNKEEQQKLQAELEQKFKDLPHVQKAFEAEYKPEILKWASHMIQYNNMRFRLERLSDAAMEDQLIMNERYIHINHLNNDYEPELISPDKVGVIKSPTVDCSSKSVAVYFIEELTIQGLITKYGYLLSSEDIESLNIMMGPGYNTGGFRIDDFYKENKRTDTTSMINFAKIESLISGNTLQPNSIEVAHQYFLVPRKIGKLTTKRKIEVEDEETGELIVNIDINVLEVDDSYKKPKEIINVYAEGKPKTAENLIEGAHVDWFYINEVWRGIRTRVLNTPVKYYNYLMNKIKELVITELMPFYILNKEYLGSNSMEDSWQDDPYFKFIISGQENGLSIADMEGANPQLLNAMPQQSIINLDRSNAIKTRWELAQLFKNEGYSVVGATPQFLGSVGQYETSNGIQTSVQRSSMQIQHLFDSHFDLMLNIHQYMIDLSQVIHFKNGGMVELSYHNSDTQNVIFRTESKNLPLSKKVGLYLINSVKENEIVNTIKTLALQDNTMGADGYEKALVLTANSQIEILDRLRVMRERKEAMEQAQQQMQQQMQELELKARREEREATEIFTAKENQLDRELEYITAQIKTLGWMEDVDTNDNNVFDVAEIAKIEGINSKIAGDLELNKEKVALEKNKILQNLSLEREKLLESRRMNLLNYQTKLKELDTKRYMKDVDMKIAKENKFKHEI